MDGKPIPNWMNLSIRRSIFPGILDPMTLTLDPNDDVPWGTVKLVEVVAESICGFKATSIMKLEINFKVIPVPFYKTLPDSKSRLTAIQGKS